MMIRAARTIAFACAFLPFAYAQSCTPTYTANTLSTPITLKFGGTSLAVPVNGAIMCPASTTTNNYFKVYLPAGPDRMTATVTFSSSTGNLDLAIYNATDVLIGSSNTFSSPEDVALSNLPAGWYKIRVSGTNIAASGVSYSLSVTRLSSCMPTYFANTRTSPVPLQFSGDTVISTPTTPVSAVVMCRNTVTVPNYFSIPLSASDPFNATLTFSASLGNLDLALYNNLGVLVNSSTSRTSNSESIFASSLPAGTYTILVSGNDIVASGVSYSLSISRARCTPTYATNSIQSARPFPTRGVKNAVICGTTPDAVNYFEYVLAKSVPALNISLAFAHAHGDLNLRLYSQSGSVIQSATSTSSNEVILATNVEAGTYYFAVEEQNGVRLNGTVYSLEAETEISSAVRNVVASFALFGGSILCALRA